MLKGVVITQGPSPLSSVQRSSFALSTVSVDSFSRSSLTYFLSPCNSPFFSLQSNQAKPGPSYFLTVHHLHTKRMQNLPKQVEFLLDVITQGYMQSTVPRKKQNSRLGVNNLSKATWPARAEADSILPAPQTWAVSRAQGGSPGGGGGDGGWGKGSWWMRSRNVMYLSVTTHLQFLGWICFHVQDRK